ncbi:flagellar biosynthesis anti-sigma factor FlgM [Kushneria aurantia]|uniref:Negative regulator of flagellin synthesis n=1 Tax=Kushneria aurantia TaxID=504092 RepID=A0ABV6G1G2_9GAMM|nr:flagellar biosynthesis anti-sigma factor FlgM [Kushneria aurantia]
MKIDSNTSLSQLLGQQGTRPGSVAKNDAAAGAQSGGDVSSRWMPSSAHNTDGDIDTARVDELREAIRDGQFEIRTDKIADGLIESARELLADGR